MKTASFSAQELSGITGGSWRDDLLPAMELSISTDTRNDNSGKIFFALRGERFDAHNFLDQALLSGCEALCIEKNVSTGIPDKIPVLQVPDTLIAMQQCAAFHRRRFPGLIVFGVTGSVGKTSVKEMLFAICAHVAGEEHTLCTIGNTNNQIGVAQNLLRLTQEHRYAIIEAGTSSPGEIAPLSAMMQPSAAIVNSIAPCHLENLIDLDGVAAEKGMIFHAMSPGGCAVFPAETPGKKILEKSADDHPVKTFGFRDGDINARFISGTLNGSCFELTFPDGSHGEIHWQLTGQHNALNAAGAAALAYAGGVEPEMICAALPKTVLPGMRMKKTVLANNITIFNDAYNANPASMHASVELLASAALPGRLLLLLGGMKELGENSRSSHKELLQHVRKKLPNAQIITIGLEFAGLSDDHFDSAEEAGKYLASILRPDDTIFAKGSRGNAVEKALPPEAR